MNLAVSHLLAKSLAPSTRASYKNALAHYRTFHSQFYANSPLLPISVEQLSQFIAVCHYRQLQPSTITSYLSAIAYVHNIQNLPSPTDSFLIKKLMHELRRYSHSDKRLPFILSHLQDIVKALRTVSPSVFQFSLLRAMVLTAFIGLLRVGEIAFSPKGAHNVLQRGNLHCYRSSKGKVTQIDIRLTSYKHSKGGSAVIPLTRQCIKAICSVRALVKYLRLSPSHNAPLFCHLSGAPVSTASFNQTLKVCLVHVGLDPTRYTAHSFRIGGATYAHSLQFSSVDIQRLGRWRSNAYLKYIRPDPLSLASDCSPFQK